MKPIFSIWIKPRRTFDYLDSLNYEGQNKKVDSTLILVSLSIVLMSILKNFSRYSDYGIPYLIIIGIITFFFAFLFLKYVYSYILFLFSKLFQGKADIKQIRIVVTYAFVPMVFYLLISSSLIFTSFIIKDTTILIYQNPITHYVLGLISLRIIVIGLSFFNKYSYGYGLMTILIPSVVIQLIGYLIVNR